MNAVPTPRPWPSVRTAMRSSSLCSSGTGPYAKWIRSFGSRRLLFGSGTSTQHQVTQRPVEVLGDGHVFSRVRSFGIVVLREVGDYGQNAPVVVCSGVESELGEDAPDVCFDGLIGDEERPGYGAVGAALGHESEYLSLAVGQRV